jgi:hypothetical protein
MYPKGDLARLSTWRFGVTISSANFSLMVGGLRIACQACDDAAGAGRSLTDPRPTA